MTSVNTGPAHRSVSSIRPQPSLNPGTPTSPHTPQRSISSAYGSPSALRAEEDCVVIELGSRFLKAGFAGDALPKATVGFGLEEQRRAGDYRQWHPDYAKNWRYRIKGNDWGEDTELWKLDLRGLDLGLVGDRLERAVREAFTKYLLVDSRPRRIALVLPSTLPLLLLSTVLDSLFVNFQPPTISLMAAPVLTTFAAGLRVALVVDIGWAETVVTGIYEYREVLSRRSIRAGKLYGEETFRMLVDSIDSNVLKDTPDGKLSDKARQVLSFQECEEVIARMAWCRSFQKAEPETTAHGLAPVEEEEEFRSSMRSLNISEHSNNKSHVSIALTSTAPPRILRLPVSKLAEPCEVALFASDRVAKHCDDEELPLHYLVYRSLLQLPVDIRSMCMPRIVFVGGSSNIPGLKQRIIDEVQALVDTFGWDPVRGKAVEQYQVNSKIKSRRRQTTNGPLAISTDDSREYEDEFDAQTPRSVIAALAEQEPDPISAKLKQQLDKGTEPTVFGHLRSVESLGAWSGGSLLSQLKIPAVSVVERDQWMVHGISGASKDHDSHANLNTKRQSMGPAAFKSGTVEKPGWSLGLWG